MPCRGLSYDARRVRAGKGLRPSARGAEMGALRIETPVRVVLGAERFGQGDGRHWHAIGVVQRGSRVRAEDDAEAPDPGTPLHGSPLAEADEATSLAEDQVV
jgi:hypothetical protein